VTPPKAAEKQTGSRPINLVHNSQARMMSQPDPSARPMAAKQLRLLKWDERVQRGDFVEDGRNGFELWEGPSGFRADAFVKKIYRLHAGRSAGANKT
jgi:hypothetical protein